CMIEENQLPIEFITEDLYHSGTADNILSIRTYYEQQWLARGLRIKYVKFLLPKEGILKEPETEIEFDSYRSYHLRNAPSPISSNGEETPCSITF
ncbi:MAG: hypothetical protein LBV64_03985, partial [Mediterranea sp.]|nr:hypothetical protein [Mediterranea sp.]